MGVKRSSYLLLQGWKNNCVSAIICLQKICVCVIEEAERSIRCCHYSALAMLSGILQTNNVGKIIFCDIAV